MWNSDEFLHPTFPANTISLQICSDSLQGDFPYPGGSP